MHKKRVVNLFVWNFSFFLFSFSFFLIFLRGKAFLTSYIRTCTKGEAALFNSVQQIFLSETWCGDIELKKVNRACSLLQRILLFSEEIIQIRIKQDNMN